MADKQINVFLKFQGDVSNLSSQIKTIQGELNKLNVKPQFKNSFNSLFGNLEAELNKYKSLLSTDLSKKSNLNTLEKSGNEISKIFDQINKKISEVNSKEILSKQIPTDTFKHFNDELIALGQKIDEIKSKKIEISTSDGTKQVKTIGSAIEELKSKMSSFKVGGQLRQSLTQALDTGDLERASQIITEIKSKFESSYKGGDANKLLNAQGIEAFITALNLLKTSIPQSELDALKSTIQQINQTKQAKIEFNDEQLRDILTIFNQLPGKITNAKTQVSGLNSSIRETAHGMMTFNQEVDMIKSRAGYFFSMMNGAMLLRRALRETINTIKELDAAMTETAVVTKFDVGDMWEALPDYTARANKLGVSIKDVYEASTLYYQQGLQMNEVTALSTETLKMARIAGMEAADATDMMTAALRGFNMEINEQSAQRVNDVYSKLAAITASDTEEIATAMTKTASIASSANMEFETTAALLAQIIETTREAPETAGTAMKTIIARFTEVKELFSEGMLTGEDSEGEEININKIDAALKSVGISLKDFLTGSKGIDDIFLELASKWDTLDIATQRYIATTAAGSRQQSRFIAMMSDYGRTMELVSAANNSAGASQAQFEKTNESLQSKLARLSNAWDEFVLGITNSDLIKFFVDLLTDIISFANKATSKFGEVGTAVSRLALLIGTFNIGKIFTRKLFSWGTGFFVSQGAKAGTEFAKGFGTASATLGAKIKKAFTGIGTGLFGKGAIVDIAAYNAALGNLSVATAGVKEQLITLGTTMGLTSTQMATAVSFTNAGMAADTAAMAAKAGLTQAEIDEAIASVGATSANSAEANAAIKAAAAAKLEELAKKGLLTTERLGLATKLKYIASLLFGNSATRLQAALTLKLGSAEAAEALIKEGQTAAQWGLNSAMLACPIGWIIAGIAALVGVVALAAAFTETAAEKTESWEKSLKGAQEAASNARDAYQELFDVKSGYEETQTALEELTKGTNEWKQALFEANQEVMELISTYPLLAQYISRGTDGQLTISAEGWDVQTSILQEQAENAMSMSLGNQAWLTADAINQREADYQTNLYRLQKRDGSYVDPIDWVMMDNLTTDLTELYKDTPEAFLPVEQISQEDFLEFYEQNVDLGTDEIISEDDMLINSELEDLFAHSGYKFGPDTAYGLYSSYDPEKTQLYSYDEQLINLADEYNLTAAGLVSLREATGELVTQQNLLHTQVAATISSMINLDEQYAESEYAQGITDFIGQSTADTYRDDIEARSEELYKKDGNTEQAIVDLANELIAEGKDLTGIISDTSGSEDTYRQVYEVLTGQEADEDWGKDRIANQIAAWEQNEVYGENAEILIGKLEHLAGTDQQTADLLDAVLRNSAEGLDLEELHNLETLGLSAALMAEKLGYTDIQEQDAEGNIITISAAQQLADDMGAKSVEELDGILSENLANIKQQAADERKERAAYARKYLRTRGGSDRGTEVAVRGEIQREYDYGEAYTNAIDQTMAALEQFGDEKLLEAGYNVVVDITYEHGKEGLEEVNDFIESMNWSNPIEGARLLQREIEHGTDATKQYAQAILEAGNSAFGASAQFEYLYQSEEFDELEESIADTVKEFGELSGSDVYDLVDSCEALQQVMDNTGITAEGMAKAISELSNGNLVIEQMTDTVLAALKGFDGLSDVIHQTISEIESFDAGIDENDVSDFMTSGYETVSGNLNKGAVGNSQNRKYLDYLFGPDWRQAVDEESGELVDLTGDAYVEAMEHYVSLMEKNQGDMRASFVDLINGVSSAGKELTWNEEIQNYEELGNLSVSYGENGDIVLNGYQGMSTDEVVSQLASAYDVTEQYARMMLTDFSNYSSELMAELNKNDYALGIEEAYNSLEKTARIQVGENWVDYKAIDQSEIDAIAELYGMDPKQVLIDLQNQGTEPIVTNFFDEEGIFKEGQALVDELNRIANVGEGGHFLEGFTDMSHFTFSFGDFFSKEFDIAKVSYDELLEYLGSQGIPEGQLGQAVADSLSSYQETLGDTPLYLEVELDNGETTTIDVTPEMDAVDIQNAIDQANKEADWGGMAEAIATAMSEVDLNITASDESTTDLQSSIETAVNNGGDPYDVPVEASSESLNTMDGEIESTVNNDSTPRETEVTGDLTPLVTKINNYFATTTKTLRVQTEEIDGLATGIKNAPKSHMALTGEEGPELVQTKDGAYVTGTNGPQMAYIHKGDTVYTADETERIFASQKKQILPRFEGGQTGIQSRGASGYNSDWGYNGGYSGSSSSGSSSNSSNSDNSDVWENGFDKLYNLVRQIDEELRQRERIERRYEKLLESFDVNAKDLVKLSREEIKQIQYEIELQKQLAEGRKKQLQEYLGENSDLQQYATIETNEYGEQVIRIDWDAINAVTNQDLGERIDEYVGQLEDWVDEINDTEETIRDMEDTIDEINERGKDEYFDFEESVRDALEEAYQKEIDELSAINDSINDTNSRLLDAMQSTIDQQRQERDNAETEEELENKQRRLEYLRQDTSGANDLEIMQLEKEIDEGYEDYTDQLIDQKISELQKQNDEAAEQREKQIDLAQAQLDHAIMSGAIWQQAYDLMDAGIDDDGTIIPNSDLMDVLEQSASFQGMSELGKMKWLDELNQNVALAIGYLKLGRQLENLGIKKGTKITFTTADGKKLTGEADDKGNVTVNGKKYKNIYQNYDGSYVTDENYKEPDPPPAPPTNTGSNSDNTSNQNISVGGYVKVNKGARFSNGQAIIESVRSSGVISGKPGAFKVLKKYNDNLYYIGRSWSTSGITGLMDKKYLTAYKTGGLADFTGPAWLDGTKARPELILNQRDTENFIQLKNVLASLMGGNTKSSENSGDSTYDIDINVESIGSDYDVEQLAEKVTQLINDTARYRNNNTISRKR